MGPLAKSFIDFGDGSEDGSTRLDITHQLENLQFQALSKGLEIYPFLRLARPVRIFSQADKVSQAWISAIPTSMSHIPSLEFSEIMAAFLALPSPACQSLVGTKLLQSGRLVDDFGDNIMCEKLPFDTWRTRHDQAKLAIEELATDAGVVVQPEVFGLFSPLIPSVATSEGGMLSWSRDRQGLVPDFLFTFPAHYGANVCQIAELKFISAGATYYRKTEKSVDFRARQLPRLYREKAKKIDQKYNNCQNGNTGPVERKLESLGELQCLVLGQFGEASQDLHILLEKLSHLKAQCVGRSLGRPVSDHERALFLHQYRRKLGITAVHSQAQCMPVREEAEKDRADRVAHWAAHVRGRGLLTRGGLHLH